MENSLEKDYVTEKIWDALEAGCIPVYMGPLNIRTFLPGGSKEPWLRPLLRATPTRPRLKQRPGQATGWGLIPHVADPARRRAPPAQERWQRGGGGWRVSAQGELRRAWVGYAHSRGRCA